MIKSIYRYKIYVSRKRENYIWSSLILMGSLFFLLTGLASLSSRIELDIFQNAQLIQFWPQGLIMSFYGLIGLIFSIYLFLTIGWKIGDGFNEFNNLDQVLHIFRWGFPGKNRQIHLYIKYTEISGIRLQFKQGLFDRKNLYIQMQGNRQIPLMSGSQPITYEKLEKQAANLAKFLKVSLII